MTRTKRNGQIDSSLIPLEVNTRGERLWDEFLAHGKNPLLRSVAAMSFSVIMVGIFVAPHLGVAANDVVAAAPATTEAEQVVVEEVEKAPVVTKTFRAYMTQYSRADSCHNIRNGKCLMASGKPVYVGAVACPYTLRLGTEVLINGERFTCEDRYAVHLDTRRGLPTVDIFVESNPKGRSVVEVAVIAPET